MERNIERELHRASVEALIKLSPKDPTRVVIEQMAYVKATQKEADQIKPKRSSETDYIEYSLTIGGKTSDELLAELRENKIRVTKDAEAMIKSPDFKISPTRRSIDVVRLRARALGFDKYPTVDEILEQAGKLGFDLCPPEVGPYLRLSYKDQPSSEWLSVGMNPITVENGKYIFGLLSGSDMSLHLYGDYAGVISWNPGSEFIFAKRDSLTAS